MYGRERERPRRPDARVIEIATQRLACRLEDGGAVLLPAATLDRAGPGLLVRLGVLVLLLVGVTFGTLAPWLASDSRVVSGHTWDAHHLAATGDADGRVLVTTTSVRRPTAIDVLSSWVLDDVVLVPSDDLGGGASGQAIEDDGFDGSRQAAWAAARRCVGRDPSEKPAAPPRVLLGGASGGLMMSLAYVEGLSGDPLTDGPVAGTGVIDRAGDVHRVSGVRPKAHGAAAAGASLFLVPPSQIEDAASPDLQVIGVGSLDEAVRALGGPGCLPRG